MFIAYFGEGLIIGSLLGLVLRPVLESYLVWRQAKELELEDARVEPPRVNIVRPFDVPPSGSNGNGHGSQPADVDERGKRTSSW